MTKERIISADDQDRARELFQRAKMIRREAEKKTRQAERLEAEVFRLLIGNKGRRYVDDIRPEDLTVERYRAIRGEGKD